VDRAGEVRGAAARPTPFYAASTPGGVETEVDALEWAVRELLSALGAARDEVVGVGVAGMAESGAPMAEGYPLGPVLAWFDGRGQETVSRLEDALGPDLARRTGRRLRSVSSVAKLGWLLEDGMPLPQRWLGVPETGLFLLTGTEATEYSLASRTGAYDVATRSWIPEVTDVLGVAPDVFPAVRPAGAPMGEVSWAAAARFGLPAGIPVTIAGHDHLAAAEALGVGDHDLLNSVGTAETVLGRSAALPDIGRTLELGLAVTLRPGGEGWVVLASAARSGLVLERLAAELGADPAELDRLADDVIAAGGTLPDASGIFERATRPGMALLDPLESPAMAPGLVWAGALQALVARSAGAAARVVEVLGPAPRQVVYGGGSRSRPWLTLKARAARPLPVVRVTTADAVARGAALAAGVAAGWWPSLRDAPPAALEPVDTVV
jgi:xylulokinase